MRVAGETGHTGHQPANFFPAANSRYGFCSRFQQIGGDAVRSTHVLKGGPGTGKSTFLQRTAWDLAGDGWRVEFYWCPSDPDSLDAIYFPSAGALLVDGTHPHPMDPQLPGAADHLVDLSRHWRRAALSGRREEIASLQRRTALHFLAAHTHLAAAGRCDSGARRILRRSGAVDDGARRRTITEVTRDILRRAVDRVPICPHLPRTRRLFLSALGPEGPVSHVSDLVSASPNLYVVRDGTGLLSHPLVSHLRDCAALEGLACWVFASPLDPQKLQHCHLPEIGASVVTSRPGLMLHPPDSARLLCNSRIIHPGRLDSVHATLRDLRRARGAALRRARGELSRAASMHREMEDIYVPTVDFSEVERTRAALVRTLRRA